MSPKKESTVLVEEPEELQEYNDPDDATKAGPVRTVEQMAQVGGVSEQWVRTHAEDLGGKKIGNKWEFRLYTARKKFYKINPG